jgi:hypothetical protein
MKPERLKQILTYDPLSGSIYTLKNKRKLIADHDGLVVVFDPVEKKSYKLKLDRIACMLAFGVAVSDNKRVLHRDLNVEDNSLKNLMVVSRSVFLAVKEAHRNLTQEIKMLQHPTDQFKYVVHWLEKGQEKQKVVHDITEARKLMLRLQLKYSKVLTKYCMFD